MTTKITNRILRVVHLSFRLVALYFLRSMDRALMRDIVPADGAVLCEAMWDNPHHWLRVILLKNALASRYGSRLVGLYQDSADRGTVMTLRSLGLSAEECILSRAPDPYLEKARTMLKQAASLEEFLRLEMPHGYPMVLLYDEILKRKRLGRIDVIDDTLAPHLALALYYLDVHRVILSKHAIKGVLLSHPTSSRFSTLAWTALDLDIPVFIINYRNEHITGKRLIRKEDIYVAWDSPLVEDMESIELAFRRRLRDIGREYLDALRAGEKGEHSAFNVYGENNTTTKEEILRKIGADPHKPNVVIFGNCWPDFPNSPGPCYFKDYVEWLRMTLHEIAPLNNVNWILRPHPAEHSYSDTVTMRTLAGSVMSPPIYWWPEELSGNDVDVVADCIVTARGSAGFEHTAVGQRVLVSAKTIYTDHNFVVYARDKSDYIEKLRNIVNLPAVSQECIDRSLVYIGLTCSAPPETQDRGRYTYPHGFYAEKLWMGLPLFIMRNRSNFLKEQNMMASWAVSGVSSYNVYKHLHYAQWQETHLS